METESALPARATTLLSKLLPALLLGLAMLDLLFILWSGWKRAQFPYDGMTWSVQSGVISSIAPESPMATVLQQGDRIVAVDGVALPEGFLVYWSKTPDSSVVLSIKRGDTQFDQIVTFVPAPFAAKVRLVLPNLIALSILLIGLGTFAGQRGSLVHRFFLTLCLAGSALLAAGSVSATGIPLFNYLFSSLLWLTPPLLFHFHMIYLAYNPPRWLKTVVVAMYGFAFFNSLYFLFIDFQNFFLGGLYQSLYTIRRIWPLIIILAALWLLIRQYRVETRQEARRRSGIVLLGEAVAILPLFALTLLPDILFQQPLVSYDISFFFLLISLGSYSYALQTHRLRPAGPVFNRRVVSILLWIFLVLLYLSFSAILISLIPPGRLQPVWINLLTILVIVTTLPVFRHWLQSGVDSLYYGERYSYQSAVQRISQSLLGGSADLSSLSEAFLQDLRTTLRLETACLLLPNEKGQFDPPRVRCSDRPGESYCPWQSTPFPAALFQETRLIDLEEMRKIDPGVGGCAHSQLWIPLHSPQRTYGILILGRKRSGVAYNQADFDILETVTRQLNVVLENIHLIQDLRLSNADRKRLHQQALQSREQERKRIARELHDDTIQGLAAINFRLESIRRGPQNKEQQIDEMQTDIQNLVGGLRSICTNLRPPSLDTLGMVASIQSLVRTYNQRGPFQVELQVEQHESAEISEDLGLSVFRFLQEALVNVQKHAQASEVEIRLKINATDIDIEIQDNGVGFVVPGRLGELAEAGHFGLLGLSERVELHGGRVKINSKPGQGACIMAHFPIAA